jgi:glycosyltransferase involved in cell wall biosynthesis
MLTFVRTLWRRAGEIARRVQPDAVIASSTYPLDIYPARKIARRSSARLIFEVHDLWPLSPMELGGMPWWHPFIFVMQRAENACYRHADRVVSMLPHAAAHMERHGMAPEKFVYIPNGIDLGDWGEDRTPLPAEHRELLDRLRGEGRFLVGYAGSHGLANALHTLIESAAALRDLDHPAAFVLVGQGPEKEALRRRAGEMGLSNVHFLPPVPKTSIPTLLDGVDALYIGFQRTPLYRFGVSPNKLMDYMMSGKPIVQAIEASNDLVGESGCGLTIPPEDADALSEAVRALAARSDDERREMGRRGRAYVLAHHDFRVLAARFLDVMRTRPAGAPAPEPAGSRGS